MDVADQQSWLPAAQRGEHWALERIYTEQSATVYALCHRLLGRPEDAEDAMQATFVQAFRALGRFRGQCSMKTWLYRIAVNASNDILRRRGTAAVPLEGDAPVADGAPAVAERVAVRCSMEQMRPDHQTILILRFWEDLSYEEIGAVLGISMPAVKMRLNRAKREFRNLYQEGAQ
ncbi:MAG TPA: sigma-70 family RNA polymerase sigma factor [Armatimonadota bacterium]|jgi:RNA polymerase sigma-70 factor (ECF subfamily)